jgi:hypothetical protein
MEYIDKILQILNNIPTYRIDNILILLAISIPVAVFESAWRRTYGGGCIATWWNNCKWIKWLNIRFVCTILNLILIFSICQWIRGLVWYWSLSVAVIIQFLYWALGHGPYFDIGRGGPPDDKMLKRYNKMFYHYILDWCFPEEHRYSHFYDFCGMWLRYTWMLLLILIVPTFNIGLLNLGTIVAIVYGLCHVAKDKDLIKKIKSTGLAEYIVGFITGLFLVLV